MLTATDCKTLQGLGEPFVSKALFVMHGFVSDETNSMLPRFLPRGQRACCRQGFLASKALSKCIKSGHREVICTFQLSIYHTISQCVRTFHQDSRGKGSMPPQTVAAACPQLLDDA
ncbi:hypothetical protein VFPPC_18020 [Pochonia chlamydosporia 170]|uniref:Uncharacterized protein n=1 Tax=Pochonia chlamydosporia 170 TaxID=1380566 RepID=A0A219ARF6_METCM|nr:hypothetical protein VFPPC_18020 [Pochonia chlamydosporia 170]OWT42765.1 hypothetical protein VFPPC_18020 [Pochonia chlamydosporia 170]